MMSYNIVEIEGIGKMNARKLVKAGVRSTGALLKNCCERKGRAAIAKETGIDAKRLLKWTNHADLMRIRGIGGQFSELLEAAGVDTVKELRRRNAKNVTAKMAVIYRRKRIARRCPSQAMVEDWIKQAGQLKPLVSH